MLLLRQAFRLSESNIFPDATLLLKVTFSVMQFAGVMHQGIYVILFCLNEENSCAKIAEVYASFKIWPGQVNQKV